MCNTFHACCVKGPLTADARPASFDAGGRHPWLAQLDSALRVQDAFPPPYLVDWQRPISVQRNKGMAALMIGSQPPRLIALSQRPASTEGEASGSISCCNSTVAMVSLKLTCTWAQACITQRAARQNCKMLATSPASPRHPHQNLIPGLIQQLWRDEVAVVASRQQRRLVDQVVQLRAAEACVQAEGKGGGTSAGSGVLLTRACKNK